MENDIKFIPMIQIGFYKKEKGNGNDKDNLMMMIQPGIPDTVALTMLSSQMGLLAKKIDQEYTKKKFKIVGKVPKFLRGR